MLKSFLANDSVCISNPFVFPTVRDVVLSDTTAALSGSRGAGCLSPGSLLVTCCEVGFRGDRSVTATRC